MTLRRECAAMQRAEEFPCKATAMLNNSVALKFMPHARSTQTWARTGSWLEKFYKFAQNICRMSGRSRSDAQCLASTVMCRHFIAHVANENKGFTRPRSARMVLSAARAKIGLPSLSEDPRVSSVVTGAEAREPRTKKQSAGLSASMVRFILRAWGRHTSWFKRQIALMLAMGFVSLMRLGEMIVLRIESVRLVFLDGSEILCQDMRKLPRAQELTGVLLHLPWRKNHRSLDCWIPVACNKVISLLVAHVSWLRSVKSDSVFLFPSRRGTKVSQRNHVGHQSVVRAMRHALTECVPLMSRQWSRLFTGHALRVGGSNEMRKLGIADEVHRRLGGWMTLVAARGYMALSAQEQFRYTLKLAKMPTRNAGFAQADAVAALRDSNLCRILD